MIKLANSFGLPKATKLLPPGRNGRPVSVSTLVRWILQGVPGPNNEVVRLAAVRLGSRWVTDEAALQQFVESLTPEASHRRPASPPTARRRAAEDADRELKNRGF